MKQPPTPKAEIVVTVGNDGKSLVVHAASPDAMSWAMKAAEAYGTPLPFIDGSSVVLYVMPNYDAAEVAEYLRSYNDEEG
jgi:hypothetical protein